MKLQNTIALGLIVSLFAQNLLWAAPSDDKTNKDKTDKDKMEQLDIRLTHIGDHARSERVTSGIIFLAAGAIFEVGAAVTPGTSSSSSLSNAALYGITGGLFAVGGVLLLAFPSQFETIPQKYRLMTENTPEELRTKVNFGEASLQDLAEDAHQRRIMSGGLILALGAAGVALYATSPGSYWNSSFMGGQVLLYEGILFAGLGIVTLIVESRSEREYKNYQAWKNEGNSGTSGASLEIKPILAPIPGGLLSGISFNF